MTREKQNAFVEIRQKNVSVCLLAGTGLPASQGKKADNVESSEKSLIIKDNWLPQKEEKTARGEPSTCASLGRVLNAQKSRPSSEGQETSQRGQCRPKYWTRGENHAYARRAKPAVGQNIKRCIKKPLQTPKAEKGKGEWEDGGEGRSKVMEEGRRRDGKSVTKVPLSLIITEYHMKKVRA